MNAKTIEEQGIEILRKNFLPYSNIKIERQILRNYILITCIAFSSGMVASFQLAKLATRVQLEQANRTSIVYQYDRSHRNY